MDKLFNDIKAIIEDFNKTLEVHLPAIEKEVQLLINQKCKDKNTIEHLLDSLFSLTMHGVGNTLYIKLVDYYKTIDPEGALFYWNQYDSHDE